MDWSEWSWLLEDPSAWGSFFAQQVGFGLAIGAVALALTLVYRR